MSSPPKARASAAAPSQRTYDRLTRCRRLAFLVIPYDSWRGTSGPLGNLGKGRIGPELPGQPSEYQRAYPRAKNRKHVQRATGRGSSHQDPRAQHTSSEQSGGRYGATPCQDEDCEICGTDVGASSQVHGEVDHRESEEQTGHSDDCQSEMEQAPIRPWRY